MCTCNSCPPCDSTCIVSGMNTTRLDILVSELQELALTIQAAGDNPEMTAAAIVQLRTITNSASRMHLGVPPAAASMFARLAELAPIREEAKERRADAASALELAQGQLDAAIDDERGILDERIELMCGLYRIKPDIPITHIAKAAGLTRARVYRIVSDTKSHPDTCPCRS